MRKCNSMVFRLTGMVFILLFLTIAVLLFLVNLQMDNHFTHYLQMNMLIGMERMAKGPAEEIFMSSVHRSLIWVGLIMMLISVGISYVVVAQITRPLLELTEAVKTIRSGQLGRTVSIDRRDEVGILARTFNDMSIQLKRNDTMRRHLFANIAHELRTPLTIVQGNLEGLVDDVIPADKSIFLSMEDEVLRLNRLVQDLRDLSLAEINELVLHKKESNVNILLQRAVSMLRPLTDEKELMVTVNLDDAIPLLYIDTDRINQVIYNILNNAIRYIDRGRAIYIETQLIRNMSVPSVQILIADTGNGIAPEDMPHIFQYFYRGEKSRSRKSGGSGIGLALARQFVLCHGGSIRAESQMGKGTTFYIILPVNKDTSVS